MAAHSRVLTALSLWIFLRPSFDRAGVPWCANEQGPVPALVVVGTGRSHPRCTTVE